MMTIFIVQMQQPTFDQQQQQRHLYGDDDACVQIKTEEIKPDSLWAVSRALCPLRVTGDILYVCSVGISDNKFYRWIESSSSKMEIIEF